MSDFKALAEEARERCADCGGSGDEMADSAAVVGIPGGFMPVGPCRGVNCRAATALDTAADLLADLEPLYWFFRMVESGGPDSSDLDAAVWDDARAAAARTALARAIPKEEGS